VTIWLLCVDFVFEAVGLRYGVEIVARFYTVQYKHMKRDVVVCAFVFVPNFLEHVSVENWQDRMKPGKDITTIKRVKFFLRHSVGRVEHCCTDVELCRYRLHLWEWDSPRRNCCLSPVSQVLVYSLLLSSSSSSSVYFGNTQQGNVRKYRKTVWTIKTYVPRVRKAATALTTAQCPYNIK